MTANEQRLLDLVSRLLPFAETRAEDLSEIDEAHESTKKAWSAVEDGRRALADAGMDPAVIDALAAPEAEPKPEPIGKCGRCGTPKYVEAGYCGVCTP